MSSVSRGAAVLADLLRAATLVSVPAAYVLYNIESAVRVGAVLLILLAVRRARIPAAVDAGFCLTMLIATWAAVGGWYTAIVWADEVVHFVTVGATSATAYFVLIRLELLPDLREVTAAVHRAGIAVLTTALGLAVATVWEFYEWVVEQFMPVYMTVGYNDTILDLLMGGLGSLVAGTALVLLPGLRPRPQ